MIKLLMSKSTTNAKARYLASSEISNFIPNQMLIHQEKNKQLEIKHKAMRPNHEKLRKSIHIFLFLDPRRS